MATTHFDTDLLRTVVAVADSGSFVAAARQMHLTQSAISMQMKRLEQTVGTSLFRRQGRSVAFTNDGEKLLGYGRRILSLHEEAFASLKPPELAGRVRIAAPDDYVVRYLPIILARFKRKYPLVEVNVSCAPSMSIFPALENQEFDLALVTCVPGSEKGLILRQDPTVWATNERHLAHEEDPLPLVLFQQCMFRDWALKALAAAGRDYRISYSSHSISSLQSATLAGLGVAVLGRSNVPKGLRILGPDDGFPELPTATIAVQRAPGANSRVIDYLSGHIEESFRTNVV
ncbi:MAG: LysR substrate-binding domain-containing protein [Gammaproteobacteria bacterium]